MNLSDDTTADMSRKVVRDTGIGALSSHDRGNQRLDSARVPWKLTQDSGNLREVNLSEQGSVTIVGVSGHLLIDLQDTTWQSKAWVVHSERHVLSQVAADIVQKSLHLSNLSCVNSLLSLSGSDNKSQSDSELLERGQHF